MFGSNAFGCTAKDQGHTDLEMVVGMVDTTLGEQEKKCEGLILAANYVRLM